MIETISGVIAAVVLIIVSLILNKYFTTKLIAATILVAIAFIYVGFALKDNALPYTILEIAFAVLLYFMAIIGYSKNTSLIAYGIIIHGVWDIFHHNAGIVKTNIPAYWPSFCFVIDIVYGSYLLYIFKKLPAWV
jgi:uncharacterized membrane protein HdeD (DUF308 family)